MLTQLAIRDFAIEPKCQSLKRGCAGRDKYGTPAHKRIVVVAVGKLGTRLGGGEQIARLDAPGTIVVHRVTQDRFAR